MAERLMALVLKTSDAERHRGFESLSLRFFHSSARRPYLEKYPSGRRGSPAKGVVLLKAARVQIPASPPNGSDLYDPGYFSAHFRHFWGSPQWGARVSPKNLFRFVTIYFSLFITAFITTVYYHNQTPRPSLSGERITRISRKYLICPLP